jgi:hypothetical protein
MLLLLPGLAAAAVVPAAAALRALAVLTLWYSKMVLRQPAGAHGTCKTHLIQPNIRDRRAMASASVKQAMLSAPRLDIHHIAKF